MPNRGRTADSWTCQGSAGEKRFRFAPLALTLTGRVARGAGRPPPRPPRGAGGGAADRAEEGLALLRPLLAGPPFSPAVRRVIIAAVQQIRTLEADRGEIARTERSALDPSAQPFQDMIDQLFYGMAGLTAPEVDAL